MNLTGWPGLDKGNRPGQGKGKPGASLIATEMNLIAWPGLDKGNRPGQRYRDEPNSLAWSGQGKQIRPRQGQARGKRNGASQLRLGCGVMQSPAVTSRDEDIAEKNIDS